MLRTLQWWHTQDTVYIFIFNFCHYLEPEPIVQPTVVASCPQNNDPEWWLLFPETPVGGTHELRCPQNGSSSVIGRF